jgi:hypothetical protein
MITGSDHRSSPVLGARSAVACLVAAVRVAYGHPRARPVLCTSEAPLEFASRFPFLILMADRAAGFPIPPGSYGVRCSGDSRVSTHQPGTWRGNERWILRTVQSSLSSKTSKDEDAAGRGG